MGSSTPDDLRYMAEAIAQARRGAATGGIPIGAVLVLDGEVIGRGHNRRIQQGDPILHGEMDCLRDAGRRRAAEYRRSTLYTTLSPCAMCSGAILLYEIPRVVLAENRNFVGEEALLRQRGVELVNLDLDEAAALLREFIERRGADWSEDIGELDGGAG